MSTEQLVILGGGGFARKVLDIVDAINESRRRFDVLGYLMDSGYGEPGSLVNDKPILGDLSWLAGRQDDVQVICAVGDPALRAGLVARAGEVGVRFCSVVHPSVVSTRWVELGEGVVIAAGCVLTNQIRLGGHVQ